MVELTNRRWGRRARDIGAAYDCLWRLPVYNRAVIDDLTDIPVFVAVVEAGRFRCRRSAAASLAFGRREGDRARLETRLDVRLFHRTTRTQNLTEDGQAFHEHCQKALDLLRAGQAMMESGRKTAGGRLRVSMPVLFGRLCVAPLLTRLTALHPALELDLNFSDRPVDLLEDGFDLAVRNGPLGNGAGLMARRVAHEHTKIFASPTYIQRHGEPKTAADLLSHRAVTYGRHGRVQPWLLAPDGAQPGRFTPPTRLRFDDLDAIADAAVAGFGLAWLPLWLVQARLQAGTLVPVLDAMPPRVSDVHVVWPETPYLATRVRLAIDALAAGLPAMTSGY